MGERWLSQTEKVEKRTQTDAELIKDGATLLDDRNTKSGRIEVTEAQIETARKEMHDYFSTVEKEKAEQLKIAVEVENTLQHLLQAVMDKDRDRINKTVTDLILQVGAKFNILELDIGSSEKRSERGRPRQFDISAMLERIQKWMNGSEIPIIGWKDKVPQLLNINDVASDKDNVHALSVHEILKGMSNPESCSQTQNSEGKAHCRNCERRQGE